MAKKTNKTHKLRGSREHGRGMKKGRGAGLRGGKGNAGWKHKKLHFLLYDKEHVRGYRNIGFTRHAQDTEADVSITLQHLDEQAPAWAALGKAQGSGNAFTVDLGQMGFDKLIGTGQVRHALTVTVGRASGTALSKIKAAGGNVTQTNPAPPPPPPKGAKPGPGGAGGAGGAPGGGKPKGGDAGGKPAVAKGGEAKPKGEAKPAKAEGGKPKDAKGAKGA